MSRQINCTVVGTASDTPALVIDNGHAFAGQFESPSRVLFFVPDEEPAWGATFHYGGRTCRYLIPEFPGAYEGPVLEYAASTAGVIIVDDHFEQDGQPWYVRGVDGFCDYQRFLDGGDVRSLWTQARDLGANLRRIFGCMINITDFDPLRYGDSFYDRLPEFFAGLAEFGLLGEFDVLPDTGYRGWSLSQCQAHWARVCDALAPVENRLVSLTNEYDHGGNLVGQPSDYPRPSFALVSQGSAVSDAPPPAPGWGFREFHLLKAYPKMFLCEDMFYNRDGVDVNGHTWGPRKPIYLSECTRFDEGNPYTDERLARTLAYESLAFGSGMVFHCDDGKFSRLLQPRQARCLQVVTDIIGKATR